MARSAELAVLTDATLDRSSPRSLLQRAGVMRCSRAPTKDRARTALALPRSEKAGAIRDLQTTADESGFRAHPDGGRGRALQSRPPAIVVWASSRSHSMKFAFGSVLPIVPARLALPVLAPVFEALTKGPMRLFTVRT